MPKVIRVSDAGHAARFNLDDVAAQAADCLARAQDEAEHIVRQAELEARDIRQQAESAGLQAAAQEIADEVARQVDQRLSTLGEALAAGIDDWSHQRQAWLIASESRVVHLAAAMARRILRRELQADAQAPLPLVRGALELAAGAARMRLVMNPADVAALGPQLQVLLDEVAPGVLREVTADDSMARGGCRVDTEHGTIDQRFETQLSRIVDELT